MKKYIRVNLTLSRIRFSIVDANVSNFFIFKKNEKLRFCVNYRNFNIVIIKNKISLFFINKTLNRFVDVAYFIKFVLKIFIIKYEFEKKTNEK